MDGLLKGPGHVFVHIPTASSRGVAEAVNSAWAYSVRAAVQHRNGLHRVGIPAPSATCAALAKYTVAEQKVLARHVTGSFLAGAAKSLWAEPESFSCPWCGQPDTKQHCFFWCPSFRFVRARHPMAVETLQQDYPEWVYCPFAVQPVELDIPTLIFASRPPPDWPVAQGKSFKDAGWTHLTFFTDGTCARPCQPAARHAAWAVVHDASQGAASRDLAAELWRTHAVARLA